MVPEVLSLAKRRLRWRTRPQFFSKQKVVTDDHTAGSKQCGSRTGMGGRSQCLGNETEACCMMPAGQGLTWDRSVLGVAGDSEQTWGRWH